jgi:hypothetical protein
VFPAACWLGIEKDKDGDFFIDHDFSLLGPILRFLRNRVIGNDKYPIRPPTPTEAGRDMEVDFYRMLEHYGLTDTMYPIKLVFFSGSEDSAEMHGSKKVCDFLIVFEYNI